ncbi:lysylphosphatidylglycerol synthase domain-containing protein [uncultured Oxalicibacterium sp.]|uniref:lysylphosphatidylglycerol synthase domain-containing protein n=1 Tax=uncultured Oxalicibacterium sp. TaxID=1168540 RepID=UPI0025F4D419|nr:lysylphosphatidylglycerol synthase domain-containing protein [uncultured Oxalicibacterium sp.]
MRTSSATLPAKSPGDTEGGWRERPWWPWLMRFLKVAFFVAVTWLIVTHARTIEWGDVINTLRERSLWALWPAILLVLVSHGLYGCFDLLGRYLVGHALRVWQVISVTMISYAFNLNLGSLVGGVAFRYRLYSRLGLDANTITRVVATSMLTNWLGYMLVAGLLFWFRPLSLPPSWKIDTVQLHWLGVPLVSVVLAYLVLCAVRGGKTLSWRGHDMQLPSLPFGLLQLVMSSANWMVMGVVIFFLLEQKIAYVDVLSVLLIAAIAGVITHVPAGLGVIEAVFVALLSHRVPANELLAGLLLYRTLYYFIPLGLATIAYLLMEAGAKSSSMQANPHQSSASGGH